jgi:hypothetical protein
MFLLKKKTIAFDNKGDLLKDVSIVGSYNIVPELINKYPIYLIVRSGAVVAIQSTGVGEKIDLNHLGFDSMEPVRFGRKTRTGYIIFLSAIKLGESITFIDGVETYTMFKTENNDLYINVFMFGKKYEYVYKKAIEFKKANKDTRFEITFDYSKYPLPNDIFKVKNILMPYSQILNTSQINQLNAKVDITSETINELKSRVDRIEEAINKIDITEFLTVNFFTKPSLNKKLARISIEHLKEGKTVVGRDIMQKEFGIDIDYKIELDIDSEILSKFDYLNYECLHALIMKKVQNKEIYCTKEELEECRDR